MEKGFYYVSSGNKNYIEFIDDTVMKQNPTLKVLRKAPDYNELVTINEELKEDLERAKALLERCLENQCFSKDIKQEIESFDKTKWVGCLCFFADSESDFNNGNRTCGILNSVRKGYQCYNGRIWKWCRPMKNYEIDNFRFYNED